MKNLSIIDKIKLLSLLNKTTNQIEDGITMKNTTKIITAVVTLITTALTIPNVNHTVVSFVNVHPAVSAVALGLSTILSLLHNPQNS